MQNAYSVPGHPDELILELCRENGLSWVPFFPLGSGFPGIGAKAAGYPRRRGRGGAGRHAGPGGPCLAAGTRPHILLIPGTSSLDYLAENAQPGTSSALTPRRWPPLTARRPCPARNTVRNRKARQ